MATHPKRARRWLAVVLIFGVAAGATFGISRLNSADHNGGAARSDVAARGADAARQTAVIVTTTPLARRPVQRSVGAVGTFYGFDELTVTAEVTGRVSRVHHDMGDIVRPGDVLLELDATDYELAVAETRRALEAEVIRLGIPVPPGDVSPDEALVMLRERFDRNKLPSVMRAREQEENAEKKLERARQLRDSNSISLEEYQQRLTDFEVARNNSLQTELDADAVVAAIKNRLVVLQIAMRKVELTRIRVPTPTRRPGMPADVQYAVVDRKVTEGEMLKDAPGTSTATFELVMDAVLKVKALVPERYAGEVKEGQRAEIRVDAYPGRVFAGQLSRISPMIERTSRTFEVEIRVENLQRELKAGGFAKVDILTYVDSQAWLVPAEAIITFAGSTRLFVVRQGRAHSIAVEPGLEEKGWVEVRKSPDLDLRADDQVITSGQERLAEGTPVSVRNPDDVRPT